MFFGLPDERQGRRHLSDRGAIGGRLDADGHRLAGERAGILDDELVGQTVLAESFGDTPQRAFVGHHERDHDGRWVPGGFGSRVGGLGDLRPMGEVAADNGVEDLGRSGAGLARRACAFTVDACPRR